MAAASCSRCGADGRSVRRRSPRCPITTGSPPWPTDSARRSGTGRRRRRTTRARSSRRRWPECCFTASRAEPWTGTTGWRRAPSPSPAVRARSRPLFASARVVHTGAPLVSPRGWSGTATRDPPGRSKTMSGHHPWSDLTKHFNTEDRKTVQTRAAEILVDSDRRERLEAGPDRLGHPDRRRDRRGSASFSWKNLRMRLGRSKVTGRLGMNFVERVALKAGAKPIPVPDVVELQEVTFSGQRSTGLIDDMRIAVIPSRHHSADAGGYAPAG